MLARQKAQDLLLDSMKGVGTVAQHFLGQDILSVMVSTLLGVLHGIGIKTTCDMCKDTLRDRGANLSLNRLN